MAGYIGTTPAVKGLYTVDEFTSSGGTTYTLSRTPGSKNNMQVSAGGLVQYPSAYSYSGTTLTLSGVPSGQKVIVRHFGDTTLYPTLDDSAVTSVKIANDAVTGAKLNPALVAGDLIYSDGTDTINRLAKGTASQLLTMNAGATAPEWASAASAGFTYGTEQATTSGTYVTHGSIPAGTSLIHLLFNKVSQSTTVGMNVQLGDAGGIEATGYLSTSDRTGNNLATSTTAFLFEMAYADTQLGGVMTLARVNTSHDWVVAFLGRMRTASNLYVSGSKTLSAELTQIKVSVVSGAFDAGSTQILYM